MRKLLTLLFLIPVMLFAQGEVTIQDGDITGGQGDVYWSNDNVYMLDGFVYVEEGTNLHIEAGTVIKGLESPTTGDIASALIIARGAKIYAMGTQFNPIIFTTEYDDVTLPDDGTDPGVDFTIDRGLWGGLVVLGRSTLNVASEKVVEGLPADEPRALYGGNDDADDSGVLRYISIRYTGITVEANKELQGLTMGCVGSGTTVEYIESFNSADDGMEFFGGTFNSKYLVSAFNEDDSFDYDQGFRGKHQFWFAIQAPDAGDHIGEWDGGDEGALTPTPLSKPMIFNATFLGRGSSATGGDDAIQLKEYGGAEVYNSIIADFDDRGLEIDSGEGDTSYDRWVAGDIKFKNNVWYKAGSVLADFTHQAFVLGYLANVANNNTVEDPALEGISRISDGGLDPRPADNSPAWTNSLKAYEAGFTEVDYQGAFGNNLWIKGWTALYQNGIVTMDDNEIVVVDDDITGGQGDVYWTNDNVYMLDGFVYVEEGTNLHIEEGTVIKGLESPSTGDIASALIIARGAKIYAMGTQTNPIIFTTEYDDVSLPDDGTDPGVDFTIDRGLWGGLVVLGKSTLNVASEKVVEGLPADEPRALYGGEDDADDSGILRYISIRYTGITVEANKELQGLTLGCVGSGTTVEYIESFNSADDGFEFFGGTFHSKYLVSAFNEDDSFDYDQGFRGYHQFWFAIQAPNAGDHIGEWDGGDEGALTPTPLSKPMIYNATFLGRGSSATGGDDAIQLKEYGGAEVYNSIIADFDDRGLEIDSGEGDTSYDRWLAGDIKFENNVWYKAGSALADFTHQDFVLGYLSDAANNNSVEDPMLAGISRTADSGLDPRPEAGSPVWSNSLKSYLTEFFDAVDYQGAFGNDMWISGWTALYQNGISAPIFTDVKEERDDTVPINFELSQNYPNPFNPTTKIQFSLPKGSNVKLVVYNILGQKVSELINEFKAAGSYTVDWNAANLSSGMYIYRLEAGANIITKKMTLLK